MIGLASMVVLGLCLCAPALAQDEPVVRPMDISTPTPAPSATPFRRDLPLTPTPEPSLPQPHAPCDAVNSDASAQGGCRYTVRPGDTLLTVALETGLDLEDTPCAVAPDFDPAAPLVIGDVLTAPPANVRCHAVQPGETLESIAAQYGVSAAQIYFLAWNRLDEMPLDAVALPAGWHLRVPPPLAAELNAVSGAAPPAPASAFLPMILEMPVNTSPFTLFAAGSERRSSDRAPARMGPIPANWPYGSGAFAWPVYGWLSQGYRADHRAIDIAAPIGTAITAADRGVVIRAGWNNQGYGNFVVIDHNIDYITLYAHLHQIYVEEGQVVAQGDLLGAVGSTGNSTGPHLHFEIRDFGRRTNPLELLTLQ
jgi:murein DD-endopeptidase MepM/ murein hydrolase activator NlpD